MIESIVTLLLMLLLVWVVILIIDFVFDKLLQVPPPGKKIAYLIVAILFLVWLLRFFGLMGSGNFPSDHALFVARA